MKVTLTKSGCIKLIPQSIPELLVLNQMSDNNDNFRDVVIFDDSEVVDELSEDDTESSDKPVTRLPKLSSDDIKKILDEITKDSPSYKGPARPYDPWEPNYPTIPHYPWYDQNRLIGIPYTITYSDHTTLHDDGNSLLSK